MSVLPPDLFSALSQLLQALASPDNAIRSQAEEQLNNEWVIARPDVLLMGLVENIHSDPSPIVRLDISTSSARYTLTKSTLDTILCCGPLSSHWKQESEGSEYR